MGDYWAMANTKRVVIRKLSVGARVVLRPLALAPIASGSIHALQNKAMMVLFGKLVDDFVVFITFGREGAGRAIGP